MPIYPGGPTDVVTACPTGDHVLGGGYDYGTTQGPVVFSLNKNGPTADGTGWQYTDSNNSGSFSVRVYAICANVTLATPTPVIPG